MGKTLTELKGGQCKFAVTSGGEASDKAWSHAVLGDTCGGGSYRHRFCGAPTGDASKPYCPTHEKKCRRGPGKDVRSLEEMMYAIDKSQYRGRASYAEHTDPVDQEIRQEAA